MITQNYRTITPAYGRDYKSAKAAEADFLGGKDFILQPDMKLISVSDFMTGAEVNIRYKRLTRVTVIKAR
jgi:hypothetical protein